MKNKKIGPVIAESLGSLTTAFGLVAALAWNEAVKSLINNFLPQGQGILSLFVYAIAVTVVAVVVGTRLLNLKKRFAEGAER